MIRPLAIALAVLIGTATGHLILTTALTASAIAAQAEAMKGM